MARHAPKAKHAPVESRAERDHRLLAQARVNTVRQAALPVRSPDLDVASDPDHNAVYTFDWDSERGSPLRPRFLRPGERPELSSASLRLLVNLTAEASPTPPELYRSLLQEAPDQLAEAIAEGIRRWHPSPEKHHD